MNILESKLTSMSLEIARNANLLACNYKEPWKQTNQHFVIISQESKACVLISEDVVEILRHLCDWEDGENLLVDVPEQVNKTDILSSYYFQTWG